MTWEEMELLRKTHKKGDLVSWYHKGLGKRMKGVVIGSTKYGLKVEIEGWITWCHVPFLQPNLELTKECGQLKLFA